MSPRAHLMVFSKAPMPGLAKTRLMPALGAQGAAALAARLLEHTVAQAAAVGPHVALALWTTPDADHPAFTTLARRHRLDLRLQGEGDLGARMHRAFVQTLSAAAPRPNRRALLLGTDAPALTTARLREALDALDAHDAVFVPALDGGYALVGLRRPAPTLFEGMRWSTPEVMADTRLRARTAGLRWVELAPVADVDVPADLIHLPPNFLSNLPGSNPA